MSSEQNSLNIEKIVHEYKSLVTFFARKYSKYGLSQDDLEQEGMLGILEAFKRYNSRHDANFGTYAGYWVKKYILQAVNKESRQSFNHTEISDIQLVEPARNPDNIVNNELILPDSMPPLEQQILRLCFEHTKTTKDIAKELNLTAEKVRQTKDKALRRLRMINSTTV